MNNDTKQFKVGTFANLTQPDTAGVYPATMYEALLRLATGNEDLRFTVTNAPFRIS
jgi:hypothetical protein